MKKEQAFGNAMISSNFSNDIIEHLFPNDDNDIIDDQGSANNANVSSTTTNADQLPGYQQQRHSGHCFINQSTGPSTSDETNRSPSISDKCFQDSKSDHQKYKDNEHPMFQAAFKSNLVSTFKESSLTIQNLHSIKGIDRRDTVLIVIR